MNVSNALKALDQEYHDGDLTQKGYMKKRAVLLEPFKNLVSVNGTVLFGVKPDKEVEDSPEEGHIPVGGAKAEKTQEEGHGPVGGARKLLSFTGEEERESHHLAEVVAIAKLKELNRERDLRKAVEEWEKKYGQWVSTLCFFFYKFNMPSCSVVCKSHVCVMCSCFPLSFNPFTTGSKFQTMGVS